MSNTLYRRIVLTNLFSKRYFTTTVTVSAFSGNVPGTSIARTTFDMQIEKQMKRQQSKFDKYKGKLTEEPVSSTFSVHVVCTGARGLAKSVLIRTAYDRYLFNCGETVQKCVIECAPKLRAVDNIFFTYNNWNNIGGLMGFMLSNTAELVHTEAVKLHGPKHVEKILQMTAMFADGNLTSVAKYEHRGISDVKFEDSQLTVEYVELVPSIEAQGDTVESASTSDDEPDPSAYWNEIDSRNQMNTKSAMAYVIKPKILPRKVDINKLVDLKVKSGPWVGKLVKGENVTLDDGRLITPEDVLLDECFSKGRPIIVFECPTELYLDSLLSSKQLEDLNSDPDTVPDLIIHMSPAHVVGCKKYQTFMERYGSETIHLMLNENSEGPYHDSPSKFQSVLHRLHGDMFPLLQANLHMTTPPVPEEGNVIKARSGLEYIYRPGKTRGLQWESVFHIDEEKTWEEFKSAEMNDTEEELRKLTEKLKETASETKEEEYPEITFLGTASAKPGLIRNASGILVQMRKDEYILLDCGEGTLVQLYQLFGDKTEHILFNLKAIFISHMHFDHHGGSFAIVEERNKAIRKAGRQDRLLMLVPSAYKKWLSLYSKFVGELHSNVCLYPHHYILDRTIRGDELPQMDILKQELNIKEFIPVRVKHVANSFGLVLTHKDDWKLVYSGDTMPCKDLVEYGKDCDILIHEGTHDDSLADMAEFKKHSTTGQAIDIAKDMNAKFLILTHFSQRYCKIPIFTEKFTENVGFAYDFMKLRPSLLPLIPLFKPVLFSLFGGGQEETLRKQEVNIQFDTGLSEEREKRNPLTKKQNREQSQEKNRLTWEKRSATLLGDLGRTEKKMKTETKGQNSRKRKSEHLQETNEQSGSKLTSTLLETIKQSEKEVKTDIVGSNIEKVLKQS